MPFRSPLRLAISNLSARRVRTGLTAAAVALAVSLVVAVTGGYASAEAAGRAFLAQFMGKNDFAVRRTDDPAPGVPADVIRLLRDDPAVRGVVGRIETALLLLDSDGVRLDRPPATVYGVDPDTDESVRRQRDHLDPGGRWFTSNDAPEAVIDTGVAAALGTGVGDTLRLPGPEGRTLDLQVVGVVRKPAIFANAITSLYVPVGTLGRHLLPNDPGRVTDVVGEFYPDIDAAAFVERTRATLNGIDPLLNVRLTRDTRQRLDDNLRAMRLMSYFGGSIAVLAATFIVFSTLSMGVVERQRTLAMLRAIGAGRGQVAGTVLIEGVALATLGVLIGVPLGWFWVHGLAWLFPQFFVEGVVTDFNGVAFAAVSTLVAATVAGLLPAWRATRIDPLEAMAAPAAEGASIRLPWRTALGGLLLASIDPLLLFGPITPLLTPIGLGDYAREVRFYGHMLIGLPALMFGFFLLAPMLVWLVDRGLSRPAAAVFGVRADLLRQQLVGGGLWRAAGTAAALMVGLSVLVVMQVQGNTALSGWRLPDRFPDVFVYTLSVGSGLDENAQQVIRDLDGVVPEDVMPVAVFSPQFGDGGWALAGAALPEHTMFVGIDPARAFDLMELDFREGDPDTARRLLAQGRHLIITEEFRQAQGYGVGDDFVLRRGPFRAPVTYTVAGVVWSPGIDVMVSTFDLGRQFEQQSGATVFGTLEDARRDFGVTSARMVAANLTPGVDRGDVVRRLRRELGDRNLNVADVRDLKDQIVGGLRRLLLLASTMAWAAMAVASLGVANTVAASVRSRRWQFGVLRSIGLNRGGLVRLILAEATLLGLCGVLLGLAAGTLMAIDARGVSAMIVGQVPPVAVPWGVVTLGVSAVLLTSLLASVWPAVSTARTDPLTLLQAGRSSG